MIKSKALFLTVILISIFSISFSQTTGNSTVEDNDTYNDVEERSKAKFRFIPNPFYDASLEWGIVFIPMVSYYFSRYDTVSPASIASPLFMITTNGSWFGGAASSMNFNEDNWRTEMFFGKGNINSILTFGILGEARVKQKVMGGVITAKRRVWNRLYTGLGYSFRKINFEGRDEESQEILDKAGFTDQPGNHGIRYILLFDNRDNIFYPYKGISAEYRVEQYLASSRGGDAYLANIFDIRYFMAVAQKTEHIIALKLNGRFLGGNPSKENYSYYGRVGGQVQRGYKTGKYVDKNMLTFDAEYRRETPLFKKKLGFVAFTGVGKVFGDFNNFSNAEWLPNVGAGVRYRILPYERMNIRVDASWGKDGFLWYFSINEAF